MGLAEKIKVGESEDSSIIAIVKDMFTKEENIKEYIGMEVLSEDGTSIGKIVGPFAKFGKAKIEFPASSASELSEGLRLGFTV